MLPGGDRHKRVVVNR